MSLSSLLTHSASRLAAAGCDSPSREAALLWQAAGEDAARFELLMLRRLAREPISQILGHKAFWSLDFYVNKHTLTPRPDSETVVEAALAILDQKTILDQKKEMPDKLLPFRLLDLGTGSGCLLLSLLHEYPHATGLGVDASEEALAVAAQNAQHLQLAARAKFIRGNWAQGLNETFDMVISNPPYIPRTELASLMPEVRDYEPHAALFAGEDGLEDYRRILADMPRLLKPGGHAVLELGIGQAEAVRRIGETAGLTFLHTRKDLGTIERAIVFTNH